VLTGYIHVADWYSTLCALASVDSSDTHEGLPATDSLNMWPYLSGAAPSSP
jgi:hypothetical protein